MNWTQITFLLLAAVFAVAGAAGVLVTAHQQVNKITRIDNLQFSPSNGKVENYLLVGSDSRAGADPSDPDFGAIGGADVVTGNRSDTVMILRRDRLAKGFDGVWESAAEVDQAAQRIVVSGDSAAKAAALAEAAARRAVLDSVARSNGGAALGANPADTSAAARAARAATPRPTPRPAPVDTTNRVRRDTTPRDTIRRDSVRTDTVPLRPEAHR
jgi:hypothetical protein